MKASEKIAIANVARKNCLKSNNLDWYEKHSETINYIMKNIFPSGSGFNTGCAFNFNQSTPEKLVINTAYHCMDDQGGYDGWIEFQVIVKPSFHGCFDFAYAGQTACRYTYKKYWSQLVEYFDSVFSESLNQEIADN